MSTPAEAVIVPPPAPRYAVGYNGTGKRTSVWTCAPEATPASAGADVVLDADPRIDREAPFLDADGTTLRAPTAAEILALALGQAQRAKGREIEHAFESGSRRDVVVDGVVYGGGMTSALLIDGTTRKNRGRGKGSAKVWPKGNRQGISLTVEQAENVSFEITAQVERDYETLQTLLNTVETATTVEAVEAIDIPPEWQV